MNSQEQLRRRQRRRRHDDNKVELKSESTEKGLRFRLKVHGEINDEGDHEQQQSSLSVALPLLTFGRFVSHFCNAAIATNRFEQIKSTLEGTATTTIIASTKQKQETHQQNKKSFLLKTCYLT